MKDTNNKIEIGANLSLDIIIMDIIIKGKQSQIDMLSTNMEIENVMDEDVLIHALVKMKSFMKSFNKTKYKLHPIKEYKQKFNIFEKIAIEKIIK